MINILFYLAVMIIVGFIGSAAAHRLHMPAVTGYLVAGLILGLTHFIPMHTLESFNVLSDLALGFIAFSIGSEFKFSFLKQVGKAPILITLFEALGAVLILDIVLIAIGVPVPAAILLGAIGAATAPAATLMVIRQYNADGPVSKMLLPVVAMDDAVALLAFSVSASIAQVLVSGAHLSFGSMLGTPLLEIGGSLILGLVVGALTALFLRRFKRDGDRLGLALAVILGSVGLAETLHLSSLLVCMMAGAAFTNISSKPVKLLKVSDSITPPLFLLFFVLSGAELDVTVLREIGLVGAVYIIARVVGKISGCFLGAKLAKAEPVVQKYLGFTLIPQAGVAIGLSLAALRIMPDYGATIRAVILCATLIYELTGPLVTKFVLTKAGEIAEPEVLKSTSRPA
jgi:Kef-type K+ transport system membrane component KefB